MEINQLMSATNLLTVTSLMLNVTDQSDPFLEERLLWFMWCFKTIKLKRISVWFPAPLIELLIRSKMDFLVQRTTAPSKLRAAGSILGQRERDEEAGEGKKKTNKQLIDSHRLSGLQPAVCAWCLQIRHLRSDVTFPPFVTKNTNMRIFHLAS